MALALFDLDDTLIDRAAVFCAWAARFAEQHSLGAEGVAMLESLDADGHRSRAELFSLVREHFGLRLSVEHLVASYRRDYPRLVSPPAEETFAALRELRARGWRVGLVTNGEPSQDLKLDAARLRPLLDGCCISALVGVRKPDRRIFELAAERCGSRLDGGWMVGDSPEADIGGAVAAGLRSVWIGRGRAWRETAFAPTAQAVDVAEAVAVMLRAE